MEGEPFILSHNYQRLESVFIYVFAMYLQPYKYSETSQNQTPSLPESPLTVIWPVVFNIINSIKENTLNREMLLTGNFVWSREGLV